MGLICLREREDLSAPALPPPVKSNRKISMIRIVIQIMLYMEGTICYYK